MPSTLVREGDGTHLLEIRGELRKADLDRAQRQLLESMADEGDRTVRLLVRLDAFKGWQSDPRWNDLSFYAVHGDSLARIAIVGEERWRGEALMFAAADLRRDRSSTSRPISSRRRAPGSGCREMTKRARRSESGPYRAVSVSLAPTRCQFVSGLNEVT